MATNPPVPTQPDQIDAAATTQCADRLVKQANAVARRIATAQSQQEVDNLLIRHERLVVRAIDLNNTVILLIANEAKVQGADIVAAIEHANEQLKNIADIKKALAVLDALLKFTAAVMTGNGVAIVKGAVALKGELDKKAAPVAPVAAPAAGAAAAAAATVNP